METIKIWRAELASEVGEIEGELCAARLAVIHADDALAPTERDWNALKPAIGRTQPNGGWSPFIGNRIDGAHKTFTAAAGRCHIARENLKGVEQRLADRREAAAQLDQAIATLSALPAPLALIAPLPADTPEPAAREESAVDKFRRLHGNDKRTAA